MNQQSRHKNEFQVILCEPLADVEIARLKTVATMYGISRAEYMSSIITLQVDSMNEVFASIATWLDNIGGAEDIFCIQKIESFFTGYVTQEVKELMRTK